MSGKESSRRRRSAAEKLRIVLAGMDPAVQVSELCHREGVNPTQYYTWRKQLLSSAQRVFADNGQKPSRRHGWSEQSIKSGRKTYALACRVAGGPVRQRRRARSR